MYEATIGIEIHAELKTKNKAFSNSINAFSENQNENINFIDLAFPGTLPLINYETVEKALKAALALNCKINKEMHFDRKNYFYPDLSKGYQITQNKTPIGYDGYIEINKNGVIKQIGIERIHIEEDTAKSSHIDNKTILNYNRAGVPLIEIVTKPCISDAIEAELYASAIRETLLYLDVSDAKMEEGSMRCEANVSIKEVGSETFGTKIEVKNIGSINNMKASIEYEIKRQEMLIKNGEKIISETRRYDENKKETVLMRIKEKGNDYRYFPEPDLPFVNLSHEQIEEVRINLPKLPGQIRSEYARLGINDININAIVGNKNICDFLEKVIDKIDPIVGANVLTAEILSYLNKERLELTDTKITTENFIKLINAKTEDKINSLQLKKLIPKILINDEDVEQLINNLEKQYTKEELINLIDKMLFENDQIVKEYNVNETRVTKFLMGNIMKVTKGNVDPKMANEVLIEKLKNLHF